MRDTIKNSAARTLWLDVWAAAEESKEDGANLSGTEIDDVAPETPEWCYHAAERFIDHLEQRNSKTAGALFLRVAGHLSGQQAEEAAERFGHCLAMQSRGHGVGMVDFAFEWKAPDAEKVNVPTTLESIEYQYPEAPLPGPEED